MYSKAVHWFGDISACRGRSEPPTPANAVTDAFLGVNASLNTELGHESTFGQVIAPHISGICLGQVTYLPEI